MSDAEAPASSELPAALSQYSARLADALGGVSRSALEPGSYNPHSTTVKPAVRKHETVSRSIPST